MTKGVFCDLSLSGSAFAVLQFDRGTVEIIETLFIDNKKNAKRGTGYRLAQIEQGLTDLLRRHPDITVVVRERGFSKFPAVTQTLFRVVGVADLTLYKQCGGVELGEIPPSAVKKLVTGNGKADKAEVELCVRLYLSKHQQDYVFQTDDVSDAVAVGIAWGLQNKLLKPVTTGG